MKKIKSFKFKKVYDLQNSSRTEFYIRILYPNAKNNIWSSSITTLPDNISKEDFDKTPVLERFNHQLKNSGLNTNHTLSPSFEWACEEIDEIKKNYNLNKYILLLPFCSPHLASKKWPYYNELIKIILNKFDNKYKIVIAPGPSEISQSKDFNATCVLDKNKAISISKLATLIKDCEFVVANDTGPAHMAAHLGVSGLALFGKHTTAHKVSIERKNFKAIQVNDLQKLSPEKVFDKMREVLR